MSLRFLIRKKICIRFTFEIGFWPETDTLLQQQRQDQPPFLAQQHDALRRQQQRWWPKQQLNKLQLKSRMCDEKNDVFLVWNNDDKT